MKTQDDQSPEKKKILIVEDEERIAKFLSNRLKASGYDVGWVAQGDEALRIARATNPDLILLDAMLPHVNGYVICRLLKFDKRFQHIPIIMLTARSATEDIQRGREAHANVYITKPFKDDVLLKVIKDQLAKNPGNIPKSEWPASPVWIDGMKTLG